MKSLLRILLGALFLCAFSSMAAKVSRPNIILIMCDDMGWSDIGCYGGEVQTPTLDRMAREGMRFTQFYNNAKCTTTRASILTGLYPRGGKGGLLRTNMVTLGEAMKLAGYQTSLSGKWHLGSDETTHPFKRGFDEYYGLLDGACNFFDPKQRDPKYKGARIRKFGENDRELFEFPKDYYTTDAFTDHAIKSLNKFSEKDEPFFLHVCYTAPHYPLHAKPEDIAKYRGKFKMGWNKMREQRHKRMKEMGLIDPKWKLSSRDSRAYDWASANHDHEDLRMAVYAAMIDSMDQNIGRLMAALKKSGEADNTLVLFLSDNGGCAEEPGGRSPKIIPGPKEFYAAVGPSWGWAQNAPFRRYKKWAHEGGIATPCIAWWPRQIKANSITKEVGHIIDFMPTFLELAGGKYPAKYKGNDILPVEGKSLLPILNGGKRRGHDQIAWQWSGNRALREGKWKLVWDKLDKRWSLFDLEADRTEMNDLASANPKRVVRLKKDWFAWAMKCGFNIDKLPGR
ncbi:MAG: arylsulfatase [Verrucomicrobiales bacterium]|nr:arylsulfatase [Verrucomicrobiales bacterium]